MKTLTPLLSELERAGETGNISVDTMAFALHLKRMRRATKKESFFAFAMHDGEIDRLADIIANMLITCTKDVRFQIAFVKRGGPLDHWSFLEFNFRIGEKKPSLDIFICDPLGLSQSIVLASGLTSMMEFGLLSDFCDLTVYLPTDTLQVAGKACAYFALDSLSMLSNQDEFGSIYEYMASTQTEESFKKADDMIQLYKEEMSSIHAKSDLDHIFNFNIVCSGLHPRLMRTMQSTNLLENQLGKEPLSEYIVNKKGETALSSISHFLFFMEDKDNTPVKRNLRVHKKREKVGSEVHQFLPCIKEDTIDEVASTIKKYRLDGLELFLNDEAHTCSDSRPH